MLSLLALSFGLNPLGAGVAQASENSPVQRLIWSVSGDKSLQGTEPGEDTQKTPSIFGRDFSNDEIHFCIIASCGPAAANFAGERALTTRLNESENFKDLWETEFVPEIARMIELDQANTLKTLDRIDEVLKSKTELKFGNAFQAILVSRRLKEKVQTTLLLAVDRDYEHNRASIDPIKLNAVLRDTPKKEALAIRLLVKMYEPLLKNMMRAPIKDRLGDRLSTRYPKLSLAKALKRDAQEILDQTNELKKNVGPFFGWQLIGDSANLVLARAVKGEDLNQVDSDIYMKMVDTLGQWLPVFQGALFQALIAVPIDLKQDLENLRASHSRDNQRKKELSESVDRRVARIAGYCRPRLNLALAASAPRRH